MRHCRQKMLPLKSKCSNTVILFEKLGVLGWFFPGVSVPWYASAFHLSASFPRRTQNKPLWLMLIFASWQNPLHYHTMVRIKRQLQFIFGGGENGEHTLVPLPSPSSLSIIPHRHPSWLTAGAAPFALGQPLQCKDAHGLDRKATLRQKERKRTASLPLRNHWEKLPWRKGNCWSALRYMVPRDLTAKPEGIQKQMDLSAPTNLKLPDKKLPVITNNIIFMQHSSAWTSSVLTTKRNNKRNKQLPN